ncbi:hypothetical protein EGJ53_12530 [Pseudomonas fluorescens]|nr:hypothetical protein EGJ53_12530 [Pseudomonas fluorescens]
MVNHTTDTDMDELKSTESESLDLMLLHIKIGDTLRRGQNDAVVTAKHFAASDPDYKIEVSLKDETLVSEQPISHDVMLWAASKDETFDFNGRKRTITAKNIFESDGRYRCELVIA